MTLIEWNINLEIGIEGFDEQHEKMIGFANNLNSAVENNLSQDDILEAFLQLETFVRYHFKTEADYFEMINYPDASGHIHAHNAFIRQLDDIQMTLESGIAMLTDKEMAFLRDWIVFHIQGLDRQYVSFVAKDAA